MLEDRKLDNGFVLGMFRAEDAQGISLCYREMYGDSFPMRYVYDPEAIIERNAGSEQHTLVVRDPDGRVAGLAGLFQVDGIPGMYELGQLMVREKYRHARLGRALSEICVMELPALVGAQVLMGEAVCNATASQWLVARHGMIPTGLELEALPGSNGRRTSLLFMFKVLGDRPHTLFVPGVYDNFVHDSCWRLGLNRRFDIGDAPQEEPADMTSLFLKKANLVRCRVRRAGLDFADRLCVWLDENQGRFLQVALNLGDPAAPWVADLLSEHGFFLGAHLPLWLEADALILQRLPVDPRIEDIQIMVGAADAVLATVLADGMRCVTGLSPEPGFSAQSRPG